MDSYILFPSFSWSQVISLSRDNKSRFFSGSWENSKSFSRDNEIIYNFLNQCIYFNIINLPLTQASSLLIKHDYQEWGQVTLV